MSEIAFLGLIITVRLRLPNFIILSFMDSEFVMIYDMFVLASGLSVAVSKYFQNAVLGYDNQEQNVIYLGLLGPENLPVLLCQRPLRFNFF